VADVVLDERVRNARKLWGRNGRMLILN
jgi:hypothetical protein